MIWRSPMADLGDLAATANRFPLLTEQEERELAERAVEGDEEARWLLVLSNLRHLLRMAMKFARAFRVPAEDLVQEGVIGFYIAACRFSPDRSVKFLTYAAWWGRQSMQRCRPDYMTVRIPVRLVEKLYRERDKETDDPLLLAARRAAATRSASEIYEDGEDDSWGSLFGADDTGTAAAIDAEHAEAQFACVREWLSEMDPRTQERIGRRFGLGGEARETLNETAGRWGCSRQRVAQIEQKAIRLLRERASESRLAEVTT
jgi:RNA polymerase sigma factor (sigma-70 family)